jgi:hypothetical protein
VDLSRQLPAKNRKPTMAKNSSTPVTTRLSTAALASTVDYMQKINSLSAEDQQRLWEGLNRRVAFAESTSPAQKQTRTAGLFPRWREGRDIDKVIAAALAMWYALPGDPYRVTVNFDHNFKQQDFEYVRDELTRIMRTLGIQYFWFSFEVSRTGRLHCHGMVNIVGDAELLKHTLKPRFGKSEDIRKKLIWGNQIVHIDAVEYAPHEGKGPEYWAAYALGDAMLTKPQTGWKRPHYIGRALVAPAKDLYKWLRNPRTDSLPFNPDDAPASPKTNKFESSLYPSDKMPSENVDIDAEIENAFSNFLKPQSQKEQTVDIDAAFEPLERELTKWSS